MRAYVDKDNCVACKQCVSVCPSVYFMDNDGKATAINDNIPENEKNKATRGRDECPVSAINLKDN